MNNQKMTGVIMVASDIVWRTALYSTCFARSHLKRQ